MLQERRSAGRGHFRPALLVVAVGTVAIAGALIGCSGTSTRPPIAVANADHRMPVESLVGGVRHVYNATAAERLVLDVAPPEQPAHLLWFQGQPASQASTGDAFALDGAGGILRFDDRLRPHRVRVHLEGREPLGVAAGARGGLWVVDTNGEVLRLSSSGVMESARPTGFDFAMATSDPLGGVWVARSSRLFSFRLATSSDPLLVRMHDRGSAVDSLGTIVLPEHVLLAEMANAGHVVASEGTIFFAPFIRDEVVALSRAGDTLWIAHRGLPQTTTDPRFEIGEDGPMIDYAPVNLGLALGPAGSLYVLSVPGFTMSESRLDVFDPETGNLVRTTRVDDPLPTLAVGDGGRVYSLDPFRVLTGIAPAEREPLADFDLEVLGGEHRVQLASLAGKVVLMNFWASWCAPCREEMPALDSLQASIQHAEFQFITMNEDIATSDAQAFIDEYGFEFPVLLGRGRLRSKFHYYGLPFTVLIDREGRTVQRWIGFAGEDQISGIRAVIQAELLRGAGGDDESSSHDGGHGSSGMDHGGH